MDLAPVNHCCGAARSLMLGQSAAAVTVTCGDGLTSWLLEASKLIIVTRRYTMASNRAHVP